MKREHCRRCGVDLIHCRAFDHALERAEHGEREIAIAEGQSYGPHDFSAAVSFQSAFQWLLARGLGFCGPVCMGGVMVGPLVAVRLLSREAQP